MNSMQKFIAQIDLDSEEAYDQLFEGFTQFDMPLLWIPIPANSVVYRSRQHAAADDLREVSALSYPPESAVLRHLRANRPSQQVFYASDNYLTTYAELMADWSNHIADGEIFAVTTGAWEVKKDVLVGIIPDASNRRMMDFFVSSKLNLSGINYFNYINSFFRAPGSERIYKLTSAFCNALLHNVRACGQRVEGLLYTSVQDREGWNFAFSPAAADANFVLRQAEKRMLTKTTPMRGKPIYHECFSPIESKSIHYDERIIHWK